MTGSPPAGWPRELPPPGAEGWRERAVGWLLDHGTGELRSHAVLRRHPQVLAWLVEQQVEAQLLAARSAYGRARRDLGPTVGPEVVGDTLAALETEGARLLGLQRSVGLVADALADSAGPGRRTS